MPAAFNSVTFYPRNTRIMSYVFAPLIVVAYVWLSFSLALIDWGPWGLYDMVWMTALGLLFAWLVWRFGSIRARAHASGLEVRNIFRTRTFTWSEIVDARLPNTQSWALLDLADGTTHAVMAIQHSDGKRAVKEIARLRTLITNNTAEGTP